MRIRSNWVSLRSWRSLLGASGQVERSQSRLASGLRVNSAADDAPALSISHRIRGQFQGLARASRNALDGVSLVSTAEGALQEVFELLQRGQVLAVQAANGTLTDENRSSLQTEMDHILAEIDRIADTTAYNNRLLFSSTANSTAIAATIKGLRSGWLEQAEDVIGKYYGLYGDGSTISVVLETSGQQSAWITGTPGINGRLDNIQIHINLSDFGTVGGPDGGTPPFYNDRKVARALTQALLARNSNFISLPDWFTSGVADYIAGRDELLEEDVATFGAAAIVNAIDTWTDDSLHRSAAYLAIKYLDSILSPFTMTDVMAELSTNDLNTALLNTAGMNVNTFINSFKTNGLAFLATLNLSDSDVGGIGGGDASGVVPNGGTYTETPLLNFDIDWPTSLEADPVDFVLQVGANQSEFLTVSIPQLSTFALNLLGVNLVTGTGEAIQLTQAATQSVSQMRTQLGATGERLEHIIKVNTINSESQLGSYSRMVDLDFAQELTSLTRNHILLTASSAVMAQANTVRQHVMWLLKDLSPSNENPSAGLSGALRAASPSSPA